LQSGYLDDLVGLDALISNDDSWRRATASPDQFDIRGFVNPLRAMQRGRGNSGDHSSASGPEPCADGALRKRRRSFLGDINVRKDGSVIPAQLPASVHAGGHCLTADEGIFHAAMLANPTDICASHGRDCTQGCGYSVQPSEQSRR
jgi:hypothetical protein